jgi:hypothetical protein
LVVALAWWDIAKTDGARRNHLYRRRPVRQVRDRVPGQISHQNLTDRKVAESNIGVAVTHRNACHFDIIRLDAITSTVAPPDRDTGMNIWEFDCDTITVAIAGILVRINWHGILRKESRVTVRRFDLNDDFVLATLPVVVECDMDGIACKSAGCHVCGHAWKLRKH